MPAAMWSEPVQGSLVEVNAILDRLRNGTLDPKSFLIFHGRLALPLGPQGLSVRTAASLRSFEYVMVILGRLMGLVLRLDGSLERLQIPAYQVVLLYADDARSLSLGLMEAVSFVRRGISDSLGVLGLTVFRPEDIMRRFGHTDIYSE
jgi:hypothetical protein